MGLDKRLLLIVNAARGEKTLTEFAKIDALMREHELPYDLYFTSREEPATKLAKIGVEMGYETIVAVGGDGTLNEVVNGIMDPDHTSDIVLGGIPFGSGNDFLRMLEITSYEDAVSALASYYYGCTAPKPIDLGCVTFSDYKGIVVTRYYINMMSTGLSSMVLKNLNRKIMGINGMIAYLLSTLITVPSAELDQMRIEVDGTLFHEGRVWEFQANNGMFAGGSMKVTPDATPDDGELNMMVAYEMSKWNVFGFLKDVYSGNHVGHPNIDFMNAQRITICSRSELNLDGELVGYAPAEIKVIPEALIVVVKNENL